MADGQFAADGCDQVSKIRAMCNIRKKGQVLLIYGLPIVTVHFGVVKVFPLNAPGLTKDLGPLGSGIDERLKLGDVDYAVANFSRAVGWDDSPAAAGGSAAGLIEELLFVG